MPGLGDVLVGGIGRRRRWVCKYQQFLEMVVGEVRVENRQVYFGG